MQLNQLGWNSQFASHFQPFAELGYSPARVAVQYRASYLLYTEQGEVLAEVSGKFHHQIQDMSAYPTVGDWAAVQLQDDGHGIVQAVLPRKSQFSRKTVGGKTEQQLLAANVDTVFLVSGLDGDFNVRRIERYLILVWESGANPVIVLNKADRVDELEAAIAPVEAIAPGVPIVALSALQPSGLDQLDPYLGPGQTVALLGSSGVGKSTLTNQLVGIPKQVVQSVRSSDSRGRHTTSHRELIPTSSGALIIDTPGLREIQLWSGQEAVEEVFTDIEDLATTCRFRDCRHQQEPGCAVQEAIATGTLDPGRLASYQKLRKELDYVARKQDDRLQANTKARWKQIHKAMRSHPNR